MNPHARIRTTVKWGGAAVCVVLAVVWLASGSWTMCRSATNYVLIVNNGSVWIGWSVLKGETPWDRPLGWHAESTVSSCHWWFCSDRYGRMVAVSIPIWTMMVCALVATLAAWRPDALVRRRARIGHCPTCNYDRRGLPATNPCPECGAVPAPSAHTPT